MNPPRDDLCLAAGLHRRGVADVGPRVAGRQVRDEDRQAALARVHVVDLARDEVFRGSALAIAVIGGCYDFIIRHPIQCQGQDIHIRGQHLPRTSHLLHPGVTLERSGCQAWKRIDSPGLTQFGKIPDTKKSP